MILRIVALQVFGPTRLRVEFNDGSIRRVDLRPLLEGPVFAALHDPARFAEVRLNPVTGTVEWPNGADLAPDAIRALPEFAA